MQPSKLQIDTLSVDTFVTDPTAPIVPGPNFLYGNNAGLDCTGCDSGCGIIYDPTA
jgi:hypothetical protein